MSKEAKYTVYFVGFLCLLIFIAGIFSGCESQGVQAWLYHDKELITKTVCDDEVFIRLGPDTIVVKSAYNSYGVWSHKEIYTYVNDGCFRVERKECVR
mgnify:FL=1